MDSLETVECPGCGGLLESTQGTRFRCAGCGAEREIEGWIQEAIRFAEGTLVSGPELTLSRGDQVLRLASLGPHRLAGRLRAACHRALLPLQHPSRDPQEAGGPDGASGLQYATRAAAFARVPEMDPNQGRAALATVLAARASLLEGLAQPAETELVIAPLDEALLLVEELGEAERRGGVPEEAEVLWMADQLMLRADPGHLRIATIILDATLRTQRIRAYRRLPHVPSPESIAAEADRAARSLLGVRSAASTDACLKAWLVAVLDLADTQVAIGRLHGPTGAIALLAAIVETAEQRDLTDDASIALARLWLARAPRLRDADAAGARAAESLLTSAITLTRRVSVPDAALRLLQGEILYERSLAKGGHRRGEAAWGALLDLSRAIRRLAPLAREAHHAKRILARAHLARHHLLGVASTPRARAVAAADAEWAATLLDELPARGISTDHALAAVLRAQGALASADPPRIRAALRSTRRLLRRLRPGQVLGQPLLMLLEWDAARRTDTATRILELLGLRVMLFARLERISVARAFASRTLAWIDTAFESRELPNEVRALRAQLRWIRGQIDLQTGSARSAIADDIEDLWSEDLVPMGRTGDSWARSAAGHCAALLVQGWVHLRREDFATEILDEALREFPCDWGVVGDLLQTLHALLLEAGTHDRLLWALRGVGRLTEHVQAWYEFTPVAALARAMRLRALGAGAQAESYLWGYVQEHRDETGAWLAWASFQADERRSRPALEALDKALVVLQRRLMGRIAGTDRPGSERVAPLLAAILRLALVLAAEHRAKALESMSLAEPAYWLAACAHTARLADVADAADIRAAIGEAERAANAPAVSPGDGQRAAQTRFSLCLLEQTIGLLAGEEAEELLGGLRAVRVGLAPRVPGPDAPESAREEFARTVEKRVLVLLQRIRARSSQRVQSIALDWGKAVAGNHWPRLPQLHQQLLVMAGLYATREPDPVIEFAYAQPLVQLLEGELLRHVYDPLRGGLNEAARDTLRTYAASRPNGADPNRQLARLLADPRELPYLRPMIFGIEQVVRRGQELEEASPPIRAVGRLILAWRSEQPRLLLCPSRLLDALNAAQPPVWERLGRLRNWCAHRTVRENGGEAGEEFRGSEFRVALLNILDPETGLLPAIWDSLPDGRA